MYLKLRTKTGGGHTQITFFIGQGKNYTKANAGSLTVRNEELPAFMNRINCDEVEDLDSDRRN